VIAASIIAAAFVAIPILIWLLEDFDA